MHLEGLLSLRNIIQNAREQTCNCLILLLIHSIKFRIRDTIPVIEDLDRRGPFIPFFELLYCSL